MNLQPEVMAPAHPRSLRKLLAASIVAMSLVVGLTAQPVSAGGDTGCGKTLACTVEVVGDLIVGIVEHIDTGAIFEFVLDVKENLETFTSATLFRLLEQSIPQLLQTVAAIVDEKLQHVADITLQLLGATVAESVFGLKENVEELVGAPLLPIEICVEGTHYGQTESTCVVVR